MTITEQIFKNKNKHVKISKHKKYREIGEHAWAEKCFETAASLKPKVLTEWQVIFTKNAFSSGRNAINTQRVNTTKVPLHVVCVVHEA